MSVYANNKYENVKTNHAWFKIFQFITPNSKVLDIGCSSGNLGKALKEEKNTRVVGIDIDEGDIKKAAKKLDEAHLINVEQDDLSKLGKFDFIIMADVIEHLVDPIAALKRVKKLLKPKGRLVFSIPNMANVTTRLELLRGDFRYKDFGLLDRTHLHFYDEVEVEHVFNSAGFVVDKTDNTLRKVPKELLKKELDKLGISLTPKLHKILSSQDAIIYQFIGVARPGKTPKVIKHDTTTPLDVISVEIEELHKNYQAEIKKYQSETEQLKELESYKAQVEELKREVHRLDKELSAILNSRGWRLLKKFYALESKIRR